MTFLRGIVGKLWVTILLLVTFIVVILSMLLLEYIDNENIQASEERLIERSEKIVQMIQKYEGKSFTPDVVEAMLTENIGLYIANKDGEVYFQKKIKEIESFSFMNFFEEKNLEVVAAKQSIVLFRWHHPVEIEHTDVHQLLIAARAYASNQGDKRYIVLYEPVDNILSLGKDTAKFLLVVAMLTLFLTTVFAFFLSSRITAPLRMMRTAVFEVARGKFETKVPILTRDEIGELAISFNQMARQLKFTMNALRQEKEQLSSILSSMADGVFTISRNGEMVPLNVNAETFFHLWYNSVGERKEAYDFMPEPLYHLFTTVVETEHESVIEVTFDAYHWVIAMTPLYSQTNVRGTVAIVRDMTAERKLEKIRKDFIANVSHELRTPIAMIQGYSEAIVDGIAESEQENKEIAQIIYDESLRMSRLVNELLDVARMEAGVIQLHPECIEIKPYFERVLKRFDGIAEDKDVHLYLKMDYKNPCFIFDGDRIEQVVTNLVDNAIRHTPEHGCVSLFVQEDMDGLTVSVKDTGVGISDEDIPFVFERFYKSDKARTRGKSGTGLGLSIVKNIIQAHHGEIDVSTKLGEGTVFTFTIPVPEGNEPVFFKQ